MSLPESSASCWLSLRRARCLKHPSQAPQTKLPAKKHHRSDVCMHLSRRHANACNLHGYWASSLLSEVCVPESVTKDNEPSGLDWFASIAVGRYNISECRRFHFRLRLSWQDWCHSYRPACCRLCPDMCRCSLALAWKNSNHRKP